MKTYIVTPHYNRLTETVLMTGQKICFYGEICKIISKLSIPLSGALCNYIHLSSMKNQQFYVEQLIFHADTNQVGKALY